MPKVTNGNINVRFTEHDRGTTVCVTVDFGVDFLPPIEIRALVKALRMVCQAWAEGALESRFAIEIANFGDRKIQLIKLIRNIHPAAGGLREAKGIADGLLASSAKTGNRVRIMSGLTKEEAREHMCLALSRDTPFSLEIVDTLMEEKNDGQRQNAGIYSRDANPQQIF